MKQSLDCWLLEMESGMSNVLDRVFAILEFLAEHPEGVAVTVLAQELDLPASATHRLLNQMIDKGYVSQGRTQGEYALAMKLAAVGMGFLRRSGVPEITQPLLDDLAQASRELVRLSVVDGPRLIWVGVAQGARVGLRYDPGEDQGESAHLATSASGLAWLSSMTDEEALQLVARQGLTRIGSGMNAPKTFEDLLARLREARELGCVTVIEAFEPGMNAVAAPICLPRSQFVVGAVSIAGPSVRLTQEALQAQQENLIRTAAQIGEAALASQYFQRIASSI